jgi:hypothetical protein
LILGRGSDVVDHGEIGEKRINLGQAHGARMALAMEKQEAADPTDISFFGAYGIVLCPQHMPHLVKETWRLIRHRAFPCDTERVLVYTVDITIIVHLYTV